MGMARAGFQHAAVIEWDHDACETFRDNQHHHSGKVDGWPVHEMDAAVFDYEGLGAIDVVSGGPPCQPFSMAGKHRGHEDHRDMFPEAIRAVRELQPKAFIFENVRGLARKSFSSYFAYILLQLQHPEIERSSGETVNAHHMRLEHEHTGSRKAPTYNVVFDVLNAANFGVAQRRERVFIVGFRSDVGARWAFPQPTHDRLALFRDKWVTSTYWEEHGLSRASREAPPSNVLDRVRRALSTQEHELPRWRTVRDAFRGLPDPRDEAALSIPNHIFIPGARAYVGHTGSQLDEPAKTLKAGQHGVPGGENMFAMDNGVLRYFTVREAARLQTFPDEYEFRGAWGETMRQLGNAVPVTLAEVVARSVATTLGSRLITKS